MKLSRQITPKPTRPKNPPMSAKTLGELGEMAFTLQASKLGFTAAQPCGERAFDHLVDNGRRCWRIQVKTTAQPTRPGVYHFSCGHSGPPSRPNSKSDTAKSRRNTKSPYLQHEIDFMALYIISEDIWYLVPWKALRGRSTVSLHVPPSKTRGNLAQYAEAWDLLWAGGKRRKSRRGLIKLMACAEDALPLLAEVTAADFANSEFGNPNFMDPGFVHAGFLKEDDSVFIWTTANFPPPDAVCRILMASRLTT